MQPSESNSRRGSQFTLGGVFRVTVLVALGCSLATATSQWQAGRFVRIMFTLGWPAITALAYWLLPRNFHPIKVLSVLTVAVLVSSLMSEELWDGPPAPLAWLTVLAICWVPQAVILWLVYLDVRDWKKRR